MKIRAAILIDQLFARNAWEERAHIIVVFVFPQGCLLPRRAEFPPCRKGYSCVACQLPGSSSSPMSSSNVHRRPESNRLTVEYIRPSRQSIQEYNDFLNDADVQAAAAASNNLELLNKLNNRLSSKRSSSSKSTAGM